MTGLQRFESVSRAGAVAALAVAMLAGCPGIAPAPPAETETAAASAADERAELVQLLDRERYGRPDRAGRARAGELLDELLRESPEDPALLALQARWLLADGRPAEARDAIRRSLALEPKAPDALATEGSILAASGDLPAARGALDQALALAPDAPGIRFELARVCTASGDFGCAVDEGRRVVAVWPGREAPRILVSQALVRMGRLEAALGELEAVPAPQRSGEILYRIGRIKLMQGDRLGARYALADANLRAPNRPEILGALFELERGAGTLAEVQILERIAQASAARPDDAALARLHGRALGSLGRFDEATKELERALALDPDDVAAYVDLASVLRARGAKSALQYLDEASAARPTSAEPYFVRGLIHEAQEDWKTAIEAYEQALAREPGFSMAKNNLAYALLQSGGAHERALALAQEARRDLPLVPEVADTLGYALLRSGEPAAALPLFRECLGRLEPSDPSVPIVELHLAEAHAARGERAEARRLAQRVISKLPPAVPGKPEPAWMARARALLAELTAP